jgi:hypothetical protein
MQNRPELLQALNRALQLTWDGDFFMAERLFIQMSKQRPEFPEGLYEYGCFKLMQGDFEGAWPLYQRRIAMQSYLEKKVTHIRKPYWDGSIDKNATLLIHRDQGYGDIFLSSRYLPLVLERLGKVIFAVPLGAGRMFKEAFPNIDTVEDGTEINLDGVDFHLHSLSLPSVFNTILEDIPSPNVFAASTDLNLKWQRRLTENFKVGLCWQGNPTQVRDAERSISLKAMAPIFSTKGVQFYGLQVGAGEEQIKDIGIDIKFEHLGPEINNKDVFVDVIAVIANMDLVITVDTSIAHLAGSMGKPVWVLLGKVPYWPYLLQSDTTPWYPTARLFRAKQRYGWAEPINAVAEELVKLVGAS